MERNYTEVMIIEYLKTLYTADEALVWKEWVKEDGRALMISSHGIIDEKKGPITGYRIQAVSSAEVTGGTSVQISASATGEEVEHVALQAIINLIRKVG